MSKKKAIEALLDAHWNNKRGGFAVDELDIRCARIAECAYDAGWIAGIREAAKLTDGSAFAVQAHSIGWRKTLENHANALAKKARAK